MAEVLKIFIVSQGDFFFSLNRGGLFDCAASGILIIDYMTVVMQIAFRVTLKLHLYLWSNSHGLDTFT